MLLPLSHQLCHLKLDDWWWGGGASLLYGLPSVVSPRLCGTQALRSRPPPTTARWGRVVKATKVSLKEVAATMKTSMGVWFVRFSPLLKRWAPGSGPLGCFVLLRGPYGPLARPVPVGDRGRPPHFPILPWAWSSLALGAVYACLRRRR
jgi:hypothetical protein